MTRHMWCHRLWIVGHLPLARSFFDFSYPWQKLCCKKRPPLHDGLYSMQNIFLERFNLNSLSHLSKVRRD